MAALLDYDQVAWGARAVDLTDALVEFATAQTSDVGWGVFQGPLDEGRAARLLAAYAALSPLLPVEFAALPTLVEALWL